MDTIRDEGVVDPAVWTYVQELVDSGAEVSIIEEILESAGASADNVATVLRAVGRRPALACNEYNAPSAILDRVRSLGGAATPRQPGGVAFEARTRGWGVGGCVCVGV